MIGLIAAAAAGMVTLALQSSPSTVNVDDPLLSAPIPDGPNIVALHNRLRTEARDNQWAAHVEPAIRARLMSVPLVGKDGNALRVTCSSTLCEIAGTLSVPKARTQLSDQHSQFNRAQRELQTSPLTTDLEGLKLGPLGALFTSGKGKPEKLAFLIYYARIH
ncbi:hypothetical protein ABDK56_09890 [Sphingomonas sp. ASV193]|uniref:hypothetical protein n=1 Tax=Sphingomonas sp. ASV193 TaxID=3144405 RepID=UPI0032E9200F